MSVSRAAKPEQPIETARLPTRCPKCGLVDPSLVAHLSLPRIWTLACKCGYTVVYRMRT